MDKSKKYIQMCKKADEIQNHWEPKNGDFFWGTIEDFADEDPLQAVYQYFECEDEYYTIIPLSYDPSLKEFTDETDAVRLPTQHELQHMVDFETPLDMVASFADWVKELTLTMQERYQTMEQLWLGFVMNKNYNKEWTGKDWK